LRPDTRALVILLVLDALIIALAVAAQEGLTDVRRFRIGHGSSVGEWAQHLKLLGVVSAGAWIWVKRRQPVYAALTALFLAVLIDDVGKLHETVGAALVPVLGLEPNYGLRAQDYGEILFLSSWAGPLVLSAVVAYRRSDAQAQYVARKAAVAVAALAAFGVGADAVHQMVKMALGRYDLYALGFGWLDFAMGVIEEGGELVIMSGIVATAITFAVSLRSGTQVNPGTHPSSDS